ncbi:hypothetical protein OO007_04750 [Cocleimonas sp. KMM 6892]|uniref:hypothetical protein n=1 Tax=unclassified Cocleimonas TaxID=2639732 RepID=UPI002DBCC575|nr:MULTISPECIES: hypothetical protein [unclassified Cocleimonas]MEB8431526.1 hypothetical protein [Cocleimonas sp. KMM 6892]MEC4713702.1 hypothetical protein [Cocleimonas sp. KMM 6895]MEC4743033.1 hypothetical protein [Cocleimonas sp. KMM 6896]
MIALQPREIVTPRPSMSLKIPDGMSRAEFFNSAANLKNLAEENGLFRTPEDLLMYRKLIGHSTEFDTSIILDTSRRILDPLGRPVRRDQMSRQQKKVWAKMTTILIEYMLEKYPDPEQHLILCGEASLDSTWPLNKPGVPSIRMIHNHFMVFPIADIKAAKLTDANNPNLTDSGHNTLFLRHLSDVYHEFLEVLDLQLLSFLPSEDCALSLTGYPQGLPSWELTGGAEKLNDQYFWYEFEQVLRGFLDFYQTFFTLVATGEEQIPPNANFPAQISDVLLSSNRFLRVARDLREQVIQDPQFANDIRWRPAYKQILYRDDKGRLIVTISQNSVGNAITELLGLVINRVEDTDAYSKKEAALVERLLEARERLIAANLGEAISAPCWPNGKFVACR